MATDESIVGRMAAEVMEQLEQSYGEDAEISDALLVLSVDTGDGNEVLHVKPSPGLGRYKGIGLVEWAKHNFLAGAA